MTTTYQLVWDTSDGEVVTRLFGKTWPQEMARRVHDAALLLDAARPGWATRVDLDRLNLASNHDCILGQAYGPPQWLPKFLFFFATPDVSGLRSGSASAGRGGPL